MPEVAIPPERVERWVANFERRHGATDCRIEAGAMVGVAQDGSTFSARLPFERRHEGEPTAAALRAAATPPADWGVLLVRKGGFAVARLAGAELVSHKIGQRHVQGRTKAGGQSQQRFARRRENQARQAYEAAADHAARLLGGLRGPLITGGDGAAIKRVLTDARLAELTPVGPLLAVADPRRRVLDDAIETALAIGVEVENSP